MTAGADPTERRPAARSPLEVLKLMRHEFVTPEAIYGTVLITVIISTEQEQHDASVGLVLAALTAFVFWLAHVFAHTVARHGVRRGREVPLGLALREAVFHSTGFLTGPLAPLIVLALAPIGLLSDDVAYDSAQSVSLVVLFVLGALALAERGRRWFVCILGGLLTTGVGVLVIALELILH